MNNSPDGGNDQTKTDPGEAIDLGAIAGLFQKWPGPMIMTVGMLLTFAATGIRLGGVEISGREFAGFEFGAVFFGGIVLIALGVGVLIARERLVVADEERRLRQVHELRMEQARAESLAEVERIKLLSEAGQGAGKNFAEAFQVSPSQKFLETYRADLPPA